MSAQTIFGMRIHVEPLRQRYTLPDDVPPPAGMTREQFNEWSRRVCGYAEPLIADGIVINLRDTLHMNTRTWEKVKASIQAGELPQS